MTGEVPPDDELADDAGELEPVDSDVPADVPSTTGELDGDEDLDADRDVLDEPDETEPVGVAPFPETSASQRTSGPTRPAVVSDAKAVRAAADEEHKYVDDRWSKYWIATIVAVFLLILLYGLLFGKAGLLSPPQPTEEPLPTDTPVASLTAAPSASALPSASASAAPTITLPASIAPSVPPSVVTTAAPSALPSTTPGT